MTNEQVLADDEADIKIILDLLLSVQRTESADKATISVNEVEFAGHVVGMGQRRPIPGKDAVAEQWERAKTVSEMHAFLGFCNYFFGFVRLYVEMATFASCSNLDPSSHTSWCVAWGVSSAYTPQHCLNR